MLGNDQDRDNPTEQNNSDNLFSDCIGSAQKAREAGHLEQAIQLFLLAYQQSIDGQLPASRGLDSLRQAWDIALVLKERTLAEFVFEKLEPYLGPDETARYAESLQRLALDKLEEFGFSSDDVADMADMLAEDFAPANTSMLRFTADKLGGSAFKNPLPKKEEGSSEEADNAENKGAVDDFKMFRYKDLIGYESAIQTMHNRGFGLGDDEQFSEFLNMLSERHGIDRPQAYETIVFRAFAREDANQFMAATVGELGLPTVRMTMEENPQGLPLLCVMASSDFKRRLNLSRGAFDGPGVLMLEDIDLWGAPLSAEGEDFDSLPLSQLSRGARDAISLIRSSVENPQVTVMVTCSTEHSLEDFFFDLLDPVCVIDIELPTAAERERIWKHAATQYPSLRFVDRSDLVRLSAHMSRFDIYMAAREAVEQAYRESVREHSYVPVSRINLFDKLAAYQPLDSGEYRELEDAAVEALRRECDEMQSIDDLLKGGIQ